MDWIDNRRMAGSRVRRRHWSVRVCQESTPETSQARQGLSGVDPLALMRQASLPRYKTQINGAGRLSRNPSRNL